MANQVFIDVTGKSLDDVIAKYNDTVKRLRAVPPGRWTNEQRRRQIEIARMPVTGSGAVQIAMMQHKFVEMDKLLVDLTQR
jgi:hypothetical protein